MRPIVWTCDGCGVEARTEDYGLPDGWVLFKAHEPRTLRVEAEADFCAACGKSVDAFALAALGGPWDLPKKAKAKAKAKVAQAQLLEDTKGRGSDAS